jgi:proline iminopeptidase
VARCSSDGPRGGRAAGWTFAALAAAAAGALLAERGLRDLGAEGDEATRDLPGDEVVPDAVHQSTMAATIAAPPEEVWPWLVQMGCGRAGWYSYDLLDNGGRPSAREIDPGLQEIAEGDVLPNVPNGATGFTVARVIPGRALVLGATVTLPERIPVDAIGVRGPTSWAFVLDERVPVSTRLVVRIRAGGPTPWYEAPVRRFWGLMHVVMQRKQLRELAARAETRP